jgi:hypothetical protein
MTARLNNMTLLPLVNNYHEISIFYTSNAIWTLAILKNS